jgi:hypothetical protein
VAVVAAEKGTKTAVIGTEHELLNVAEAGVYTFEVDCNKLVAGDTVELRIYKMVLTGGTPRVYIFEPIPGAQPTDGQVFISEAISNELTDAKSLQFTLKQTAGTGREFPWKVLRHS